MSKKQARQKKMKDVEASLAIRPTIGPKPLIIAPQIAVSITGTFPDQELFIEAPNLSGSRHKVRLTPETAYKILMDVLMDKAGGIELERQLQQSRLQAAKRPRAQPDWRLIAQHPEAVIIERLPTRSPQLASNKAELPLEEMGL